MKKLQFNKGDKFNKWTILEDISSTRRGHTRYRCQCECGTIRDVYASHLKRRNSKSCGCIKPQKSGHYKWTGYGDLTGNHWNQITRNAQNNSRGPLEVNITIKDAWELFLSQDRKCALSGIPIALGNINIKTASLDRIDSKKGYVKGNIQWVHKDINRMKNIYGQEQFIKWCRLIAAHCFWK